MGMPFRIVLYERSESKAAGAATAAFRRIGELNSIFSNYEFESEVSRLTRTSGSGTATPLSDPLWDVLAFGQNLASESGGAFDVTVGPATALWRKARRENKFPEERLLEMVRGRVGFQHLVLDESAQTALLEIPHMSIDLGGIAKGYALEAAHKVIRDHGIEISLVQAGGDMRAGSPPPGKHGWLVMLENPTEPTAQRHVMLTNEALATSGDLNQFVEFDGERYSHIVDPRTCIGLTNRSLVVVISDSAMVADSLATTLGIVEQSAAESLARSHGIAALIHSRTDQSIDVLEFGGFSEEYLTK